MSGFPFYLSCPPIRMRQFAPLLLVLLSAVIAAASYLQALNYPFISDDLTYIADNAKLAGLQLAGLWRIFIEPYNPSYEFLPLRDLSYWIDLALFGQNPAAFRLHNILLYLLCLPLVYATTQKLWRYFRPANAADAPWAAAAVTALFALHPALVESVVWISGRKYVLPDFFSMLAFWLAVNVKRENSFSPKYATATLIAFVAVMFSKSSYVAVAPAIAVLWLVFWLDIVPPHRRRSLLLWPFGLLLLAALLLLVFILSNKGFDTVPAYFGIEAIIRPLAVLGGLARIAISPEGRHFSYPVFEDIRLPAMIALGVALLAAVVWGFAMFLRRRSFAGFSLLLFFLLCLPYLQLIPAKPPSLVADRYIALAIWPVALLVVALAWRLKPVPRTILLLVIALPFCMQTIERPRDWRNFEALVDADLRTYPGYYMPVFQKIGNVLRPYGRYREQLEIANNITDPDIREVMIKLVLSDYDVRVKTETSGKPDEAIARLENIRPLLKDLPLQASWNTPLYLFWSHARTDVMIMWLYLLKLYPQNAEVQFHAGLYMLDLHKDAGAAALLQMAAASPSLPESMRGAASMNLGFALLDAGRAAEAETPLRASLAQPHADMQAYCLLAEVYKQTKRFDDARRAGASCPRPPAR